MRDGDRKSERWGGKKIRTARTIIDNNDNNKRKKNKIKRDGDGDYGLIHWK